MTCELPTVHPPLLRRAFVAARRAVLEALGPGADGAAPLDAISRCLGAPVRLLGVEPADAPRPGAAVSGGWCLHLCGAEGRELVLRIDDALAGVAVADLLGIETWAVPADGGGEPLAGVLGVQALRCLAELAAAGCPLELVDLHRDTAEPRVAPGRCAVSLRVQAGSRVGRVVVHAAPREAAPRAPLAPWAAALPVSVSLVVARGVLPRAALRAVRPGDAVTFDEAPRGHEGAEGAEGGRTTEARSAATEGGADGGTGPAFAWLATGGPCWLCRAEGAGRWTIERPVRGPGAGRDAMATTQGGGDRTEVIGGDQAGPPIDEVPIEVTAVAGRATMTVGALSALAPGSVVALGRSPGGTVDLLANGVAFARGRLVDLEGELAVEVTELRGAGGRASSSS